MKTPRILVVDAGSDADGRYSKILDGLGAPQILLAHDSAAATAQLAGATVDLVIIFDQPPTLDGVAALRAIRQADADLPAIVVTSESTAQSATECLRLGAGDYLVQPVADETLVASVERLLGERRRGAEYELLRRQIERPYSFDDMVGGCAAMRKVFDTIEQVAGSDVDVLIVGETGAGKELIARSIHRRSRRAAGPYVPVDCGAIPDSLLESEFFGHEKGAFTGAELRRIGLLEFADRGTFFLDELGELPMLLQAKLLRTLQERKIRRVGGREEIDIDVRIVAATARNLDEMIRLGQFRQDLYYRINVVRIDLPPLRERGDDIGLLAEYLANKYGREMERPVRGITPEAYQVLASYRWPGNVRELQNVIRRGIAMAHGSMITLEDLPDELVANAGGASKTNGSSGYFELRDQQMMQFEQQYIGDLLARHHGDVRTAAIEAKLPRGTLYRLMKKHGLDSGSFR